MVMAASAGDKGENAEVKKQIDSVKYQAFGVLCKLKNECENLENDINGSFLMESGKNSVSA